MRWWLSALWLLGCVAATNATEAKPRPPAGRSSKLSKPALKKRTPARPSKPSAARPHRAQKRAAPKRVAAVKAPTPAPASVGDRDASRVEPAPRTEAPPREPEIARDTSPSPPPLRVGLLAEGHPPDRVIEPPGPTLKRVTVTANPLALIIGRYGANVEILIAPHHAITASGFVQTFSKPMLRTLAQGGTWDDATRPLFGGELGYRVYSGREGAAGLFAGASFVTMPIAYPRLGGALRPEIVSYHAHGGAIDVGVSAIVRGGVTIGGGLGVMALAYPRPESTTLPAEIAAVAPPLPTLPAPRVLPRLLFTAGYSF